MHEEIAGVGLRPQRERLYLPLKVAGHLAIVLRGDVKAFRIAGSIAKLVALGRALGRERRLTEIAVRAPHVREGDRELRVEIGRALEQRKRRGVAATGSVDLQRRAIRFERLERRRGRLL